MLTVRLPSAPPAHYIRWMTWWRTVETAMLRDPRLEEFASEMSAPFLASAVALFLSDVAHSLLEQAAEAETAGAPTVEPELSGPGQFMEEAVEYLEARGAWLDGVLEGEPPAGLVAIAPLDADLRSLRRDVVGCLRTAVGAPATESATKAWP
jgi:hypothetical protein